MAKVIIPTPLRKFTNNLSSIETEGETVRENLYQLVAQYPTLKQHLFDDQGRLRRFVRLFLDENDIHQLQQDETRVAAHQTISIIPAIAGGTHQKIAQ